MKILMIMRSQAGVPGGTGVPGGQIGMVQLARALARSGADVEMFVGGPPMKYLEGLQDVSTTFFGWPSWLDRAFKAGPAWFRRYGAGLRRQFWLNRLNALPATASADVIHIQGLDDADAVLGVCAGPLVVTHWGRAERWIAQNQSRSARLAIERSTERIRENVKLVAIGEAQAQALTSAGMPPQAMIPPGIDLTHFRPRDRSEARGALNLPDSGNVVLYVGRLAFDKNVATLLRAFARVQELHSARLIVVGDGPLRSELEVLGRELQIEHSIQFRRFVPHQDLPAYYQAADVTVVTSDVLETFCMVALEAIACKCPLIVTDQVPEIIRRFPTVPSVSPYDVEGLTRMLIAALGGEVACASTLHLADYDWGAVARRYLDLYQAAFRRPV